MFSFVGVLSTKAEGASCMQKKQLMFSVREVITSLPSSKNLIKGDTIVFSLAFSAKTVFSHLTSEESRDVARIKQ